MSVRVEGQRIAWPYMMFYANDRLRIMKGFEECKVVSKMRMYVAGGQGEDALGLLDYVDERWIWDASLSSDLR